MFVTSSGNSLSRSALNRLGKRWVHDELRDDDPLKLREHLDSFAPLMAATQAEVRALGFECTSRLKTEISLKGKVTRGSALGNVQDIAGIRIVEHMTLVAQDALVRRLREHWPKAQVVDRRRATSHGYRAVHVVVEGSEKRKVEIQVRTFIQETWAQMMESWAAQYGRGIRYGGDPDDLTELFAGGSIKDITRQLKNDSKIGEFYEEGMRELMHTEHEPKDDLNFYEQLQSIRDSHWVGRRTREVLSPPAPSHRRCPSPALAPNVV